MTQVIEFIVLGFASGAAYAMVAQGVVLIYRGSGVVNFAQGAFAFVGAVAFHDADSSLGWVGALVMAIVAGALCGALTQNFVMRPLSRAAPLARVIASLGLLIVIQSIGFLHYQSSVVSVPQFLSSKVWHIGGVPVGAAELTLLAIAVVVTVALALMQRRTLVGLATIAASENGISASSLGWSPNALATFNWTVGGALAGAAGAFLVPLTGLLTDNLVLIILPALAAAVLGGFESFSITLVGALGIGIAQSLITRYWSQPGVSDALPLAVIIVVLVVTGRSLPLRSHVLDRMPRLGSGRLRPGLVIAGFVASVLVIGFVFNDNWTAAWTVSLSIAVVMLSVVVVTGYAGQISLAQYALAGMGAYVAGRLVSGAHWGFVPAAVIAIVVAVPIGLLFAIPALRTRGVNLAVITLGLALTVNEVLFSNINYTGGAEGTNVTPTLFGLNLSAIIHPTRYLLFVFALFTLSCVIVANLRRSAAGRRLVAIRENERAAASIGISVMRSKLYAFAVGSAVAALGGILVAFAEPSIEYSSFDPFSGVYVLAFTVIGGLGFVVGPLVGSLIWTGGVFSLLNLALSGIAQYLALIGGAGLIITLLLNQNGIVQGNIDLFGAVHRRWQNRRGRNRNASDEAVASRSGRIPLLAEWLVRPIETGPGNVAELSDTAQVRKVTPQALVVEGLTVRFGSVTAVNGVDLKVSPGEVVGLIGPNGAGKTTFIDGISGFVSPSDGAILLGDHDLTRESTAGRVALGLVRSWQSLELLDDLTVAENIGLAAESDEWNWRRYISALVMPGKLLLNQASLAAISDFQLGPHLNDRPGDLSYGQRRLVSIARAVASNPSVILLDEPAAGLSTEESRELGKLIRRLADTWGMGVLLVEHDVDLVMSICNRIAVLEFGNRIAEGTPDVISSDPAVIGAYLGTPEPTVVSVG